MRSKETHPSPFTVCVIGNPYDKNATSEALYMLENKVGEITSRPLIIVDDQNTADLRVVIDVPPQELSTYADIGPVMLVAAQKRKQQSLNTYVKECRQSTQSHSENIKGIININSEEKSELIQKWWSFQIAMFSLIESY